MNQQQISVVTVGIFDLAASRRFYVEGFGWTPVFENKEIVFYQMNGFVFGTWLKTAMEEDLTVAGLASPGAVSLAHNVTKEEEVEPLMARLAAHGGRIVRPAGAPPHGGLRGHVADPDGHFWEIAFNPAWAIDHEGHVTFGV